MSRLFKSGFRRYPRYRVIRDADITATIAPGGGSSEPRTAKVLEISMGGVKLEADAAIHANESIIIRIEGSALTEAIELKAVPRWVSPARGGVWQIGCAFEGPLSAEVLHSFAREGILDRRLYHRNPILLSAFARWELDDQESSVTITDHSSQGGFRLVAISAVQPGSRVELLFDNDGCELVVRGKIRWQRSSEQGYQVGCEFLGGRDAVSLSRIVDQRASVNQSQTPLDRCLRSLKWTEKIARLGPILRRREVYRPLVICMVACLPVLLQCSVIAHRSSQQQRALSVPLEAELDSETDLKGPELSPTTTLLEWQGEIAASDIQLDHKPVDAVTHRGSGDVSEGAAISSPAANSPDESIPLDHRLESTLESTTPVVESVQEFVARHEDDTVAAANPSDSRRFESHDPRAVERFRQGCLHYSAGRYERALEALQSAVKSDPTDPKFHYVLALTQFQQHKVEQAERSVITAVDLELERPVVRWGRVMERFQGRARAWLEHVRRRTQSETDAAPAASGLPQK